MKKRVQPFTVVDKINLPYKRFLGYSVLKYTCALLLAMKLVLTAYLPIKQELSIDEITLFFEIIYESHIHIHTTCFISRVSTKKNKNHRSVQIVSFICRMVFDCSYKFRNFEAERHLAAICLKCLR